MVGNLHVRVKIDLEGKQKRHSCQEPGLLGSAGEGLARAPGQEAWDTSPLGFRDPLLSGQEGVCMVMGALCSVFLPPPPKRTSYLKDLHTMLRIKDQHVGGQGLFRKSRMCGCHVVGGDTSSSPTLEG